MFQVFFYIFYFVCLFVCFVLFFGLPVFFSVNMGPVNLSTMLCLLNWLHVRSSAIEASFIAYSVRQACLDHVCSFKQRQTRWSRLRLKMDVVMWAINLLPRLTPQRLLSRAQHTIWTNQSPTDFLRLIPTLAYTHTHTHTHIPSSILFLCKAPF